MKRIITEGIVRSWWVWLFALICISLVESLSSYQGRLEKRLLLEIAETKHAIQQEKERSNELRSEIASSNDPSWIEKALREELGVAAKGEVKVYFYPRCGSHS